jgi:signal-transduction protein with cAMP-binding, CBS, and nucleotidyltransferase domain
VSKDNFKKHLLKAE